MKYFLTRKCTISYKYAIYNPLLDSPAPYLENLTMEKIGKYAVPLATAKRYAKRSTDMWKIVDLDGLKRLMILEALS